MPIPESISVGQARRIALAAQGFLDPRPTGLVTRRSLQRVVGRTSIVQIDSVNVLARAHYLPFFSRLGTYRTDLLDAASYRSPRALFEYWAHMASYVPVELHPFLRWRMAEAERHAWGMTLRLVRESPEVVDWVREEVRTRGPLTAGEIELDLPPRAKDQWGWNWSDAKTVLEWLFLTGEVTVAGRTNSFARLYDLPERVLPAAVLATPTPSEAEAFRELVSVAARALGIAAEPELRDYFRLSGPRVARAVQELAEEGTLRPVSVAGWRHRAWLHADARLPRRADLATLVSPFDPLVWERGRTERLFDFHYRIGIYTRPHEREHGYYALPFLLGDQLVARVDLKADRRSGVLLVPGAWVETGHDPGAVAQRLAPTLVEVAQWLGLASVGPVEQGSLAVPMATAQGGHRGVTVVR